MGYVGSILFGILVAVMVHHSGYPTSFCIGWGGLIAGISCLIVFFEKRHETRRRENQFSHLEFSGINNFSRRFDFGP